MASSPSGGTAHGSAYVRHGTRPIAAPVLARRVSYGSEFEGVAPAAPPPPADGARRQQAPASAREPVRRYDEYDGRGGPGAVPAPTGEDGEADALGAFFQGIDDDADGADGAGGAAVGPAPPAHRRRTAYEGIGAGRREDMRAGAGPEALRRASHMNEPGGPAPDASSEALDQARALCAAATAAGRRADRPRAFSSLFAPRRRKHPAS